jgi:hypothetical protein
VTFEPALRMSGVMLVVASRSADVSFSSVNRLRFVHLFSFISEKAAFSQMLSAFERACTNSCILQQIRMFVFKKTLLKVKSKLPFWN